MKRKKLIAALTAAAMVVTMLPSVAMAKGANLDVPANSKVMLSGSDDATITMGEPVSPDYVNKNVNVSTIVNGNTTTAVFQTKPGTQLPYVEKFTGFTGYDKYKANYEKHLEELELANGNYVECIIALGEKFSKANGSSITAIDHPEQNQTTDKVTFGTQPFNSEVTEVTATKVFRDSKGVISQSEVSRVEALKLVLKVPVGGSETFKIDYDGKGENVETLKLDFTGVNCETANDVNVKASVVEVSALEKTFSGLRTEGLDTFVNKNVTGNYNLDAHRLSLTSNGYVPYKTGFKRFNYDDPAQQEGNYVAFTFTVGANMTSEASPFEVTLENNYDPVLKQKGQFPDAVATPGEGNAASHSISVMKLLDAQTVNQQVGRYQVSCADGTRQLVLVDYSGLNLVTKKEANDAAVAAEYITKNIPAKIENTAACKNAIDGVRAAYDALTAGGQAQVQMMHTDAYNKLINAESEYAKVSQGTTTTPTTKPTTSTTTSDVVKKGATVNVNGATYKVTGSKTVTYKKAPTNKKTVKVPATIKIKGKTYKVTAIANNAFKGNKKVKTVTVGKNVKTIGSSAFQNCKALTKVTLPAKTTTIKKNAFANSKKLKTVVVKSKKMTKSTVKANAFKKTSKKATFNVPNNKVNAYTKLFRQKGLPKACKIK